MSWGILLFIVMDGRQIALIHEGRFVLEGTEELNEVL